MAEKLFITLRNNKEVGASMLEYALLAALISIVAMGAIRYLGENMQAAFTDIGDTIRTGNVATGARDAVGGAGGPANTNW